MDKIKPYLFWYVCGGIIVVILASFFFAPSSPEGFDAATVKSNLDSKQADWDDIRRRAQLDKPINQRGPMKPFNPENEKEREELSKNYLVTPQWQSVLEGQIKLYDDQLAQITTYLKGRSAPLRRTVLETASKREWYEEYENQSSALVRRLHEAGCLDPSVIGQVKPGSAPDYRTDANLRSKLGLSTKGADYPEPTEWQIFTRHLRIVETIADRMLAIRAATVANPVVKGIEAAAAPATGLIPALRQIEWATSEPSLGPSGIYADGTRMTLQITGPIPALNATIAAFDRAGDDARPITEVLGSTLSRKERFEIGERKDIGFERAELRFELLVLDFTKAGDVK